MQVIKRDTDDIEEKANNLVNNKLFDLFSENKLKLVKNESGRREIGIDYFYQVFDRNDDKQVLFFETQNKGTDKPVKIITQKNHSEKGCISFSLEIRHAKQYYFQLTEPILFFLCDINDNKAYWYSVQLDKSLPDKISNKENELVAKKSNIKRPKIQIYIPKENEICSENFERLIKDIEWSRAEQTRKHNSFGDSEDDYSVIEKEIKGKHIIDQANITIGFYEGLNILPSKVISKLPFIKGSKYKTYIRSFSLNTDNEEIYNLLSSVKLTNNKLELLDGAVHTSNQEEKINNIINFFKANNIRHLKWSGKSYRKQICIHDLFVYEECNCSRCNFDKLDFNETERIIKNQDSKTTIFEKIRDAYSCYLIGDLETSVDLFNNVLSQANKTNNPILCTLAIYNLTHLKRILKHNFFGDNRNNIIDSIKDYNLQDEDIYIKRTAPHFIDSYNWIKDSEFYNSANYDIDETLNEVRKMHYYDKHGTTYNHNRTEEIVSSFTRFYSFLEYNFIIYDYYYDYQLLMTKVLESIFALYKIINPKSAQYEKIGSTFIKMWIFHISSDKAKTLLNRYNIKKFKTTGDVVMVKELETYIKNLSKNIEKIISEKKVYYFEDKIKRIISNIVLVCSRLDATNRELNSIASKILKLLSKIDRRDFIPFDSLNQLLVYQKDISKENNLSILELHIKYENFTSNAFSLSIKNFVENSNNTEIKNFIFKFLGISNFDESMLLDNNQEKLFSICYPITSLDNKTKTIIEKIIINSLKENFEPKLYELATIFNIIDFDKQLFDKFISTIPNQNKDKQRNSLFQINENFRLSQAINIAFKNNLTFNDDLKKLVERCLEEHRDYYEWLMDLEGFDYTKFNSLWVLEHRTIFYINAFKKSKTLKKELKKSLREEFIEGVAKFYINDLA